MNKEDAFEEFCLEVLELLPEDCDFTMADARRELPKYFDLPFVRRQWSPARVAAQITTKSNP